VVGAGREAVLMAGVTLQAAHCRALGRRKLALALLKLPIEKLGRPLSTPVQNHDARPKHACDQNAECDVVETVRENVHDSRPVCA
jgi:hypothetical protein